MRHVPSSVVSKHLNIPMIFRNRNDIFTIFNDLFVLSFRFTIQQKDTENVKLCNVILIGLAHGVSPSDEGFAVLLIYLIVEYAHVLWLRKGVRGGPV